VAAFAHNFLRPRLIVPEFRIFGLGVQFIKALCCLFGVKDASSAVPATARSCRPKPAFPRA